MVLVSYDSDDDDATVTEPQPSSHERSRDEGDDDSSQPTKKPAPALPANFQTLYSSNVRSSTTDDPALHGGRQRQVPHIVGNWPTFIYLEWLPSDEDLAVLDQVIADAASQLNGSTEPTSSLTSSLRSDLGVRLPLHISLSAPLTLSTDNKNKFEEDVKASIKAADIPSFRVLPAGLRCVHNFDKTRYFLILTLQNPEHNELQRLLTACNRTAEGYDLPQLYGQGQGNAVGLSNGSNSEVAAEGAITRPQDGDKFHISIGWTLHEPASTEIGGSDILERLKKLQINFDKVHLKIGSGVCSIRLT